MKVALFDKTGKVLKTALTYAVAVMITLIFFFPFIYMFLCSLQPTSEAIFQTPISIFPKSVNWVNYKTAFINLNFINSFFNTLTIMVCSGVIQITCSVVVAYGFARFENKYSEGIFMVLMATMMLPWIVTMVPSFVLFKFYGWIGTKLPLIAPALGGSAYNIFMLRNFMRGIPRSLDEAAILDGCSTMGILTRILLPNMKPIIMTMIVFTITGKWSDYVAPSIYLLNSKDYTLTLALAALRTSSEVYQWNEVMAACVMITLPMLGLLFSAQNVFMRGIVTSSVKG
ncbi:MAG: carbohydrate ABC transporter permease [Candidatus Borkfalkiaceae bacterium]|nr:carbohydrate ABC transporter permease [Christensenellaceae bacterium]